MIGEANSNTEAMKKEIIEQAQSYSGIIDEKDNRIAKVHTYVHTFVCTYRDIVAVSMYTYTHIYNLKYYDSS